MEIGLNYLESVKSQLLHYKTIGEKAINQLEDSQLFINYNEDTNSIFTIVKHLAGNMISRWTDFLISDGEKEWRNRDAEFENNATTKQELLEIWNNGWSCFFDVLNTIKSDQLLTIILIRNEKHTILEALNRQLPHYSYHVGQIIFYAKMLKSSEWKSLSIPKNSKKGNKL